MKNMVNCNVTEELRAAGMSDADLRCLAEVDRTTLWRWRKFGFMPPTVLKLVRARRRQAS